MQVVNRDGWIDALGDPTNELSFFLIAYQKVNERFRTPPDRTIEQHLMYFVADGTFPGSVERSALRLDPGTLFLLPPGIAHCFWVHRPAPVVFSLRFRLLAQATSQARFRGNGERNATARTPEGNVTDVALGRAPLVLQDAWDVLPYLDQLFLEFQDHRTFRTERIRDLLRLAFIEAFRVDGDEDDNPRRLSPAQRRRLLDYVRMRGDDLPSPRDLARAVGLSDVYFSRVFRNTFGKAPRTWLKEERVRRGAHLLMETDLNVSEVAARLGYSDFHLFSRQFRQVMDTSPSEYRKRH